MSRIPPDDRPDRHVPDDDIAALFEARAARADAPPPLDDDVLAAARAPRSESDLADTAGPFPVVVRHRTPPRWLAAAAVVVLALALVPLLRQAPAPPTSADDPAPSGTATRMEAAPVPPAEVTSARVSERDSGVGGRQGTGDELEEPAPAALAESPPLAESAAPAAPRMTLRARSSNVVEPDRDAANDAAVDSAPRETMSPLVDGTGDGVAPSDIDDPFDGYRDTPDVWLERLRERLREIGATPALLAEYERFRIRHPDLEPGFDPREIGEAPDANRR